MADVSHSHTQLVTVANSDAAQVSAGSSSSIHDSGSMMEVDAMQIDRRSPSPSGTPSGLQSEELGQLSRLISKLGLPDKDIQLVQRLLGTPSSIAADKGKGRELPLVQSNSLPTSSITSAMVSTLPQSTSNIPLASPRTRWNSPSGSITTANNAIQSLFDEADRERLLVENAQLRRQAVMVANKRLAQPISAMPSPVIGDATVSGKTHYRVLC